MIKFLKEILCYFGVVILYIISDFFMYKGHLDIKKYLIFSLIWLFACLLIKFFCFLYKKCKKSRNIGNDTRIPSQEEIDENFSSSKNAKH